jgi:hypothetical protein
VTSRRDLQIYRGQSLFFGVRVNPLERIYGEVGLALTPFQYGRPPRRYSAFDAVRAPRHPR